MKKVKLKKSIGNKNKATLSEEEKDLARRMAIPEHIWLKEKIKEIEFQEKIKSNINATKEVLGLLRKLHTETLDSRLPKNKKEDYVEDLKSIERVKGMLEMYGKLLC